jgi:hypothetical protein
VRSPALGSDRGADRRAALPINVDVAQLDPAGAGAVIGKFVAEGNAPTIIDLDGLTVGAQERFMTAFCEEVYRRNTRPLHLVIEEADEFAPMTVVVVS